MNFAFKKLKDKLATTFTYVEWKKIEERKS